LMNCSSGFFDETNIQKKIQNWLMTFGPRLFVPLPLPEFQSSSVQPASTLHKSDSDSDLPRSNRVMCMSWHRHRRKAAPSEWTQVLEWKTITNFPMTIICKK
jgi:hypothetical protein